MKRKEEAGLESLAAPTNEPITPEELVSLGEDITQHCKNPTKALQLLKVLDRKKITGKMLLDTKIGKKLAIITTVPNPDIPDTNDEKKMRELKEMKEYLKKKWQTAYTKYKEMKELRKEVPYVEPPKILEKYPIPYIPNDIDVENDDNVRSMQIRKFITKLQTPETKASPDLTLEALLKAIKLAIILEKEIFDASKNESERK